MNKKGIYYFLISILMLLPISSHAACPDPDTVTVIPKLTDVEVKVNTTLDPKTGIYSYSYSIENGKENIGCIWSFEVDIKKPEGTIELSKEGLTNAPKGVDFGAPDETSPPMIPVAFPSVPKKNKLIIWSGGLSVYGTASWGSDKYIYEIMPGDTLTGLVMTSYGLPGIRDFKIKPKFIADDEDIIARLGVTQEDIMADNWKYLNAFYDSISWKGKTIGPTAPPVNFVALDFLAYLVDLKHKAAELGWIGGPKFVTDLDKKLDQAKEKLQSGNIESAKGKLKSFINKIEAQLKETKEDEIEKIKEDKDKKFVTSEGYGLLKFNAEYLRNQLGQGEEEDKED